MKKTITLTSLLSLIILTASINILNAQVNTNIRLNQLGFYTNGPKAAVIIESSATTFTVKSPDRIQTLFNGTLSTSKNWAQSGENAKIADFSSFQTPGKYVVEVPGLGYSYEFLINDDVYQGLNHSLLKAYYYNRASTALPPKHASIYSRSGGHFDTEVVILPSAASPGRPAGTKVSSPKGWYDAGDYNCYIVNSGISTYQMLMSYEHFENYYNNLDLNIPESSNNIPDILDEIKWNLDWMLTMQDPFDGGVYNKKTDANFDSYRMPAVANDTRYMTAKGTAAAFDFAAVMAVAFRIYQKFDLTYANQCLEASKKAYTWGLNNPNVAFNNPPAQNGYPAITTGGYGDGTFTDEREWASNELYIATGTNSYYTNGFKNTSVYSTPSWPQVRALGLFSLVHHRKKLGALGLADTTLMKSKLTNLANTLVNYQKNTSAYGIAQGQGGNSDFPWGSNSVAGNQGVVLINAYLLSQNPDYLNAALSNLDYLLGRNALGYSFITGFGTKIPTIIHHRPSLADGIAAIQPGWVVGGPTGPQADGCASNATFLAKSWEDADCYSKTEVTINWNSPAVYLTSYVNQQGVSEKPKPSNSSIPIPGVIEAENFDKGDNGNSYYDSEGANLARVLLRPEGVDIANIGVNSFAIAFIEEGEWVDYSTNISKSGLYLFTFRAASLPGGGIIKILVDGNVGATANITTSGGWNAYNDFTVTATLPQGNHGIRLFFEKGAFNLDRISTSFITSVEDSENSEASFYAYPNPASRKIHLNSSGNWMITSLEGNVLMTGDGEEIDVETLLNGVYLIQSDGKKPFKIEVIK